jgi:MoaA/NifB/PqqE/SkfB family radical SAM enzyme
VFDTDAAYDFHIELTDKCNAGCPMCGRTDPLNGCRPNEKVRKIELTLEDFRTHFTPQFCTRVGEVQFGGGLGDALAGRDCLEAIAHLTGHGVTVVLSTNGSLRSPAWWTRLGEAMKRTGSRLELHIDGLADTNPLYRVNTDFEKIMENARAYLATGAHAEWYWILFRHNEHQVEQARDLAYDMGFADFVLIDTIRFGRKRRFDYVLPSGERRALEPPTRTALDFRRRFHGGGESAGAAPERPAPERPAPGRKAAAAAEGIAGIRCKAQINNRPYITADGQVSACCWIDHSEEERALQAAAGRRFEDYNIRNRPLEEILHDEPFASLFERGWRAGEGAICQRKCGLGLRNTRARI